MLSFSNIRLPSLREIQGQLPLDSPKTSVILDQLDRVPKWVWVGTSCMGAAVCLKVYYDRVYGVFKKQGIPGPTPLPIVGNSLLLAFSKGAIHDVNVELFNKYGENGYIGTFNGSKPTLVIADPDLICDVMIKQFDVFTNRMRGFNPNHLRKTVSLLRDDEWRRVRNYLSPTFTGFKLKKMMTLIGEMGPHLCDRFEQVIKTESQAFELKSMYRACTMDMICNIMFANCGADTQNGDNRLTQACMRQAVQNASNFAKPLTLLCFFVPAFAKVYGLFSPALGLNLEASDVTADFLLQILKRRREGHTESDKTFFLNNLVDKLELHEETKGKEGMDFETTVAQALVFLMSGFDTTANLLMWTSYYLAIYPDLQDRVYEEIVSLTGPNGEDADYDTVNKMNFLENVLMETSRVRPVFRTQRQAATDTVLCNGIKVKKGWMVEVAINVIHNDPKIWKDPENFRPSRFDPEESKGRSPYAFNAFGVGNRNCVGMRLTMLKVKMAFVKILSKYRLSKAENTPDPDQITDFIRSQFYDPIEPLFLKVSRR